MKELDILNKIAIMKVSEFIPYFLNYNICNIYDIIKDEELDDEGIQECKLIDIIKLDNLVKLATLISESKELKYPREIWDILTELPEELLPADKFDKLWNKDKREAKIMLAIASNLHISYTVFRQHLNNI